MSNVTIGPEVGGCDATPPGLDDYCGPTSVGGWMFGHPLADSRPPVITPRVYLAGQALAGMLASDAWVEEKIDGAAVRLADAVLARLKESE